jgi:putative membrane protein
MFPKHVLLIVGSCFTLLSATALAQSAKLSPRDKEFLKMAAVANMTEAHLGQLAESQASRSSVKDFGQTLVKDHTSAYQELAALDSKLGETIPKGINVRRDKTIEELAHVKGKRFDVPFLRDEVRDHERAIAAFKREAQHGQDQDIKAYANQVLPTMEEHLREAEKLLKNRA